MGDFDNFIKQNKKPAPGEFDAFIRAQNPPNGSNADNLKQPLNKSTAGEFDNFMKSNQQPAAGEFDNFMNANQSLPKGEFANFMEQQNPAERRKSTRPDDSRVQSVYNAARVLGIKPIDLATAVSYETAGTFDPWKAGPTTKWGLHRGLIQFGEPQRKDYGVSQNQSFEDQMETSVVKYLRDRGVRPGMNLLQIYKAINGGNVNVSGDASDGYGTINSHVGKMMREHRRKAENFLGGQINVDAQSYAPEVQDVPQVDIKIGEALPDVYPTGDGNLSPNASPITKDWTLFPSVKSPTNETVLTSQTMGKEMSYLPAEDQSDVKNGMRYVDDSGTQYIVAPDGTAKAEHPEKLPLMIESDGKKLLKMSNQGHLKLGEMRVRDLANDKGGVYVATKTADGYSIRPENAPAVQENIEQSAPAESEFRKYLAYTKQQDSSETRAAYENALTENPELSAEISSAAINQPNSPAQPTSAFKQNADSSKSPTLAVKDRVLPQMPSVEAKTDDDILKGAAGTVAVNLRNKPAGENAGRYLLKTALQNIAPQYGLTEDEITQAVERVRNKVGHYSQNNDNVTDEQLKQSIESGADSVEFTVTNDTINDILNARDNSQGLNPELSNKINLASSQNAGNVSANARQSAESKLSSEEVRDRALRQLAEQNVTQSPFADNTEAGIEAEYQRLKTSQLSEETEQVLTGIGQELQTATAPTLSPFAGRLTGGVIGGLGRLADNLAGLERFSPQRLIGEYAISPMFSLAGIPFKDPSKSGIFQSLGNGARIISTESAKGAGFAGELINAAGGAVVDVPKLIGLSYLPGGAIVSLAVDAGTQSAGRGEDLTKVGTETAKGAILGALFGGASKLSTAVQRGTTGVVGEFVGQNAVNNPAVQLTTKTLGEAVRIAAIFDGSFIVENKVFGSTENQAFKTAITNTLFDLVGRAGKIGEVSDLAGKIFRMRKGDNAANVTVDAQGNVKLLKGEVDSRFIDAEFDLSKVKDVELDADGVYTVSGETSSSKQNGSLKGLLKGAENISTAPEPLRENSFQTLQTEAAKPAQSAFDVSRQVSKVLNANAPEKAVLVSDISHLDLIPQSAADNIAPIPTSDGVLLVNKTKAAAIGLDTNAKITDYVNKNGAESLLSESAATSLEQNKGVDETSNYASKSLDNSRILNAGTPPLELAERNPLRIETADQKASQKISTDARAQKINSILADGKTQTLETLQKATRYTRENIESAIDNLFNARMIEVLPDNTIRRISSNVPEAKPASLYEKYSVPKAESLPSEIISQPKAQTFAERPNVAESLNQTAFEAAQTEGQGLQRTDPQTISTQETRLMEPGDRFTMPESNDIYEVQPQGNYSNKGFYKIRNLGTGETFDRPFKAADVAKLQITKKPAIAAQSEEEKPKEKARVLPMPAEFESVPTKQIFTERGTSAKIVPKVIDASDLLTSLDEGYPPELQPRDRTRAASKAQISEIANKLNPALLDDSPKASDGRPLVVPVEMPNGQMKYAVISGNGRSEAIRQAYSSNSPQSAKYSEFAVNKSEAGPDTNQPVYVGVLNPNEINPAEFAKEANETATAQMSATEQAKTDSERITPGLMNKFAASDDGSIHASANRDFVRGFIDSVASPTERGKLIDSVGNLSQEGIIRVKNAIFAKAFGDTPAGLNAISRMAESTDNNVKNISNALLSKAGQLAELKEAARSGNRYAVMDITPDLSKAMEKYSSLKDSGTSVEEYLGQGALFGAETTPFQNRIIQTINAFKGSSKAIKSILNNYLSAVEVIGDPNQKTLFGETRMPSAESIFEGAVRSYEESRELETSRQVNLFNTNQGREAELGASGAGDELNQSFALPAESAGSYEKVENLSNYSLGYDVAKAERLKEAQPIELYREAMKTPFSVTADGLEIQPEHIEIIRRVGAVVNIEKGYQSANVVPPLFKGKHIVLDFAQDISAKINQIAGNYPPDVSDFLNDFAAAMLDKAEFDGSLIVYTTLQTRNHELHHQASELGSNGKYLSSRVNTNQGANLPEYQTAAPSLVERGYKDKPSVLLEEIAAHINGEQYKEIGLTTDAAKSFMKWWYNSYAENGGNLNHPKFDAAVTSLTKGVLEDVRNGRKQTANTTDQRTELFAENGGTNGRRRQPQESSTILLSRPERQDNRKQSKNKRDQNLINQLNQFGTNFDSTNTALTLREPAEILFSLPTADELNPENIAEKADSAARIIFSYIYDGKRDVSFPEAVMNLIRTGILASIQTFQNNLVSNTAMQVSEQSAKPFMVLADILNPKTRNRHVAGIQPLGIIKGLGAVAKNEFQGNGFFGGMRKGVSESEASKLDMTEGAPDPNFVRNTGIPLIDGIIEITKRFVVAGDRPFKAFVRESEKRNLAKVTALNKAKFESDVNWREEMKRLLDNPTELMSKQIEHYADVTTFQNSNAFLDFYGKAKRTLIDDKELAKIIPSETERRAVRAAAAVAYISLGQFATFVNTPVNVGLRTLEYFFPTGVVKAAWEFYRIGNSPQRAKWLEDAEIKRRNYLKHLNSEREREDADFTNRLENLETKFREQSEKAYVQHRKTLDKIKKSDAFPSEKGAQIERENSVYDKWIDNWNKKFEEESGKIQTDFNRVKTERDSVDAARDDFWDGEDAGADAMFSAMENRAFAEAAGRAGFGGTIGGLLLLGVVYGLIEATGTTDYEDEKAKAQAKRAFGIPDDSIKIGRYRFKYSNNPFGYALKMGINLFEQSQRPGTKIQKVEAMSKRFGKDLTATNPLAQSALSNDFQQDSWGGWAGSKLAAPIPRVLGEIGEVIDDKPRKYFNEGFAAQFYIKLLMMREKLPESKNYIGGEKQRGDLTRRALRLIDPVKAVEEQKPQKSMPKSPIKAKKS